MADIKEQIFQELDSLEVLAQHLRADAQCATKQTDLEVAILTKQVKTLREKNENAKFNSLVAKYNKPETAESREAEKDAEINSILKKIATNASAPKAEDAEVKKIIAQAAPEGTPKRVLKSVLSEPPKPPSGRVLKGSFGVKPGDKPKTVIVSAADLARQRIEERAKKIREALMAKNKALHPEAAAEIPVKRPRGRPRKNPLPQPPTAE